mgnify:CR=1 FL=1
MIHHFDCKETLEPVLDVVYGGLGYVANLALKSFCQEQVNRNIKYWILNINS